MILNIISKTIEESQKDYLIFYISYVYFDSNCFDFNLYLLFYFFLLLLYSIFLS